ncbi:MAG TPA: single-stranded DNA-binding protein [Chthonomonadaceae bacterium]|nr:single-stranded DNA-binding protein [Chthonomonadaceae bacterium]
MSLNRIVLVGRLTRDPEMKYTPQGVAVATMGIAVDRFSKNEQGEYETDFFNIVAWRRSAEFASNYLKKGRLVSIDGRLQTRSWVDQASGQKRTVYEVVAENIQGLDKRGDAEASGEGDYSAPPAEARGGAPPRGPQTRQPANAPPADDIDDSDPFADE